MNQYDFNLLEDYFIKNFKQESFKIDSRDIIYILEMFMYPSGNLHLGHTRQFMIGDVIHLSKIVPNSEKSINIFRPIGWDSFGLPAEQAALKSGILPSDWTRGNISNMSKSIRKFNLMLNWEKEISTCEEEYYRWDQFFFLKMMENDLIYRRNSISKWCDNCQTILSNEQSVNGKCWRCRKEVDYRTTKQFFIKISSFAEELYLELDDLLGWPTLVRNIQREWIGRKEISLSYLENSEVVFDESNLENDIEFLILSDLKNEKESLFSFALSNNLDDSISKIFFLEEKQSRLYLYTYTKEEIDHLRKKFGLSTNLRVDRARIENFLLSIKRNKKQEKVVEYSLKDWCISRQRYWGAPIPLIDCPNCSLVPCNLEDLPIRLPSISRNDFLTIKKGNPLEWATKFVETICTKCKGKAKRITDTMDTFFSSSWYMFRFFDNLNNREPFSREAIEKILPIDYYIGGNDHATSHLLFFRFFCHFLKKIRMIERTDMCRTLITQGMVLSQSYNCKEHGYLEKEKITKEEICPICFKKVTKSIEKMSKSKANGVSPDEMVEKYGSDCLRLFLLFLAPIDKDILWDEEQIIGMSRFLNRVYSFYTDLDLSIAEEEINLSRLSREEVRAINSIKEDISSLKFNLAIAKLMSLFNVIVKEKKKVLIFLLPFLSFPLLPNLSFFLINRKLREMYQFDLAQFKLPDVFVYEGLEKEKLKILVNGKFLLEINSTPSSKDDVILSNEDIKKITLGKKIERIIHFNGGINLILS